MSAPDGIWFVYRTHYEGPLSKRIRRLAAPSILAWFQAKIEEARTSLTPRDVGVAELGGPVQGLRSFFEAAHTHSLHTPKTTTALRKLLVEHLSIESPEENIQLDAHSVRIRTDDEQVGLAYYFFDDEVVRRSPDRVAYLLLDEPRLPEDVSAGGGSFSPPVEVSALAPTGSGEGATYVALLTFADSDSLPGTISVFPGVRVGGLVAHLRSVTPQSWPIELRVLRAMIDPGDTTLTPALKRAAAYPLGLVAAGDPAPDLGAGPLAAARAELLAAAEPHTHGGDPSLAIIQESAGAVLFAPHASADLGHQQWILFDDRWASAHPDLAASILRYGRDWDPFAAARPAAKSSKALKAPKSAKDPKAPRAPKAARPTRASTAAAAAATKHQNLWHAAVADRTEADARVYAPSDRFQEGELIQHAKFGLGVVLRSDPTKCEVLFAITSRIMLQGAGKA